MRLIDADDVLSIVDDLRDRMTVEGYCAMVERVKALPSAEPSVSDCWGCNCPKMENEQKTFSEMVHLRDIERRTDERSD